MPALFLYFASVTALSAFAQSTASPTSLGTANSPAIEAASVSTPAASVETVAVSTHDIQLPVIRGIHVSGWGAGIPRVRRELIARMKAAGLNAVVIALKESDGLVFVRGVPEVDVVHNYANAIPDLAACVKDFKDAGIYAIGRVALFKDNALAHKKPEWAVHRPDGALWLGKGQAAWADPYSKDVWNYDLAIAERVAKAGFDEVQFDYVRFPSDGPVRQCRYSRADHTKETAAQNLVDFLAEADKRLHPLGVKISIDVFGQTTTDDTGLGIGQHIAQMAEKIDYVCPMMYPSHYYRGVYNLKDPTRDPYRTIYRGLTEMSGRLKGLEAKVRPYLQDFSLGHHYGPKEVKAQIFAAARVGVTNWTLWNPGNHYTWAGVPAAAMIEATARAGAPAEAAQSETAASSSTTAAAVKETP